ncbi:MAG: glycosyltransferase family 4 protein [Methylomonas sp.]|nr:glycosyltransferase family 4 protein [Methylomonas sp.]
MKTVNSLVVTTLYPNQVQFRHGVFIETRMKYLGQSAKANITVIAPVPWFPIKSGLFPAYSKLVDIPRHEVRYGIDVYHPRYIVIPKIGMLITPFLLAFSIYRQVNGLKKQGFQFDLIDAHYYYPDGVAAAIISVLLKLPLMITARGTDINLIPNFALPRKMIVWASKVARFNLAVCNALRQKMIEIGVDEKTAYVSRNGVDLKLFMPMPRDDIRRKWQVKNKLLISVGYLIERKGHHLVIEAMQALPDYQLFIVGGGEWEGRLKNMAEQFGVQERVRFLGEVEQQQLPELYNCADALVLASSREGWANVLLESMACGTPVVASNIWGTPEVVQSPEAGVLCGERSAQGIAAAVKRLFANYPDRTKTRQYAEKFSWDETTESLLELYEKIGMGLEH